MEKDKTPIEKQIECSPKSGKTLEDIFNIENLLKISGQERIAPINPNAVAKAMGIKVFNVRFEGADEYVACIIKNDPDGVKICINKDDKIRFKRYMIAHAIGHILNGHAEDGDWVETQTQMDTASWNAVEQKANDFAVNLLMPQDLIEKALKEGIVSIHKLAQEFEVPKSSMKARLNQLGYEMVEKLEVKAKPVQTTDGHRPYRSGGQPKPILQEEQKIDNKGNILREKCREHAIKAQEQGDRRPASEIVREFLRKEAFEKTDIRRQPGIMSQWGKLPQEVKNKITDPMLRQIIGYGEMVNDLLGR